MSASEFERSPTKSSNGPAKQKAARCYVEFLKVNEQSYATLTSKMPDDLQVPSAVNRAKTPSDVPQFATAEYAHIPGTERCRICGSLISGEYFRVNNQMACGNCAAQAQAGQPTDSHAAFARGLLLGAGAAVLGLILYATVVIVTGWSIGYLALAVGWLVATAIMKGSNGIGGMRYQIAAVILTYAAISMASVPILISYGIKHRAERAHQATQQSSADDSASDSSASNQQSAAAPVRQINWGAAAGQLALWGLASPFLALSRPGGGILGLVILFVGLSIAFRMTAAKPLNVDGPYKVTG